MKDNRYSYSMKYVDNDKLVIYDKKPCFCLSLYICILGWYYIHLNHPGDEKL